MKKNFLVPIRFGRFLIVRKVDDIFQCLEDLLFEEFGVAKKGG